MKTYLLLFAFFAGGFISCSEDDDGMNELIGPSGSLSIRNQVYTNNEVFVDRVKITQDGWIAIYRRDAQREEPIGYTFIDAGEHEGIEIELGAEVENGEILLAKLHHDANSNKVFDWDGENGIDLPLKRGYLDVSTQFWITIIGDSWIYVHDQPIGNAPMSGSVNISYLDLQKVEDLMESETAWLVAYRDNEGEPGELAGLSEMLSIQIYQEFNLAIDQVAVGEKVWLVLHNDTGQQGIFEPGLAETDTRVWDPESQEFLMTAITILK